jgi:hypothetical protein
LTRRIFSGGERIWGFGDLRIWGFEDLEFGIWNLEFLGF